MLLYTLLHIYTTYIYSLESLHWGDSFFWLCWGLTTRQPLRVILCRLPEKGRKEIEERVEEMKERDREEKTEEIKTFPLYPYRNGCPQVEREENILIWSQDLWKQAAIHNICIIKACSPLRLDLVKWNISNYTKGKKFSNILESTYTSDILSKWELFFFL